VNYKPQLTADVAGLIYLDWQRRGSTYFDVQNRYSIAPTNTFNGRVGVEFDGYQLSLYGRNLTDERFPVLFQADAAGIGTHGQLLNMPRTYGVELKAKF
jgi:iron complex outermembrane receptor protein